MVVIDVQRAGPSTGMPTKTEQSDLLQALYGRHGESPLPVIAPSTPGGCFDAGFEAVAIAIRYRTPVILLADTFLASSSEPWRVPSVAELPEIDPAFATARSDGESFAPYSRDERLARPWAIPGTPGLQHRSAGWRRRTAAATSPTTVSITSCMTELRADKVAGIAREIPPVSVDADPGESLLVLGWGSSEGSIRAGARALAPPVIRSPSGTSITSTHFPPTPAMCCARSIAYWSPMNTGQLAQVLRARFLVDVESFCKVQGQPLFAAEIEHEIAESQ